MQALDKAIAAVRPGMRFREVGDIISQHVGQHKYQVWGPRTQAADASAAPAAALAPQRQAKWLLACLQVVRSYCGHGIGDLFHCAPNIPHYAHNKVLSHPHRTAHLLLL